MPYTDPEKHRECQRRIRKASRANPEHREKWKATHRKDNLRKQYGLTPEQWDTAFDIQGNVCAICKSTEPGGKGWCTDHNHTTLALRDILCISCNLALGQFKDDPNLLRTAADYLESHANPKNPLTIPCSHRVTASRPYRVS